MTNIAQVGPFFTVEDVKKLRDNTRIGTEIEFYTERYTEGLKANMKRIIKGKVIRKYSHVFELDTGETFAWVDYLLGKRK